MAGLLSLAQISNSQTRWSGSRCSRRFSAKMQVSHEFRSFSNPSVEARTTVIHFCEFKLKAL